MSRRQKGRIPQKSYYKEVSPGIFKKVSPKSIPISEFFATHSRMIFGSTVVVNPLLGQ